MVFSFFFLSFYDWVTILDYVQATSFFDILALLVLRF